MSRSLTERFSWPVWALLGCAAIVSCSDDAAPDDAPIDDSASAATLTGGPGTSAASPSGGGSVSGQDPGSTSGDSPTPPGSGESGGGSSGGEVPDGFVPAFVAQGHMGRTMLSCDDGQTWIANRSLDDTLRCFEPEDCDHHVGSATGITYGPQLFVATWGWGTQGRIEISDDGVEWTTVLTGPTFSGTAFGTDVFIAGARLPYRADAAADAWTELPDSGLMEWTPRGIGFADGIFVIGGGGGDSGDVVYSADNGDSWQHPASFDGRCGASVRGISGGGGTLVIASGSGLPFDACVSTDNGATFESISLPEPLNGAPFWTGDEFIGFGDSSRMTSADGLDWDSEPYAGGEHFVTAVARSSDGTVVATRDGWLTWYEQQVMYRSDDGITWSELPAGAFVGSHPIRRIASGYVRPHPDGCAG